MLHLPSIEKLQTKWNTYQTQDTWPFMDKSVLSTFSPYKVTIIC